MALDFFHGHGSPYSWRVWLALEHKAIAYELKVLSFAAGDTKKPEFVAINPRHQVPTIVDDGYALWESLAILEYLDERFVSGRKLYPGGSRERSRIRRLALEAASYVGTEAIDPITDELFYKDAVAPDMDRVAKGREKLREELEYFARELRGDYLAGASPTAADFVLYPYMGYVKRITLRKPESKLTEVVPANIDAWAKRIEALPYFDKTYPPHWK
jgi:glutathione S-transferase